jgi:hypothetical protein
LGFGLIVLVIRAWKKPSLSPLIADGLQSSFAAPQLRTVPRPGPQGDRPMTLAAPVALMLAALSCLYYVFYLPGRLFLGPEKTRAGYLRERKDAVYENLRDLNFEYRAGKLPDADYASLRANLLCRTKPPRMLAEIDAPRDRTPYLKKESKIEQKVCHPEICHPERRARHREARFPRSRKLALSLPKRIP